MNITDPTPLTYNGIELMVYPVGAITLINHTPVEVQFDSQTNNDIVNLDGEDVTIAKLVALAFLGTPPAGSVLRYKEDNYPNLANLYYEERKGNTRAAKKHKIINIHTGQVKTITNWNSYDDKINWQILPTGKGAKRGSVCTHIDCEEHTPYKLCYTHRKKLEGDKIWIQQLYDNTTTEQGLLRVREQVEALQDEYSIFDFIDSTDYNIDDYVK